MSLSLGAAGVFAVRIFAHHLFERIDRLVARAPGARDVEDLIVVGGADQILGVSCIRTAGMQRDVTLRRIDAIGSIPRPDNRRKPTSRAPCAPSPNTGSRGRPHRISWPLPCNHACPYEVNSLVIKLVGRLIGNVFAVFLEKATARESHRQAPAPRKWRRAQPVSGSRRSFERQRHERD